MTVHLRVNDAATGRPTPCRLRIAGTNGEYFAPFGRVAEFSVGTNEDVGGQLYLGNKRYAYIDGACEIRLPTGVPLDLEITKGLEFAPIRETVTLGSGKMALRFTLQRHLDTRAEGWLSADTRCHFLSPHSALLEAAAEDIGFAHLLATVKDIPSQDGRLYRTIANMPAFSGQRAALEADGHSVIVNTLNTHPALGRLALLNCHRPVYPLSFGTFDEGDDWSLGDWCDQCHRKKGLVLWCDAFRPEAGLPGGEALIAAILGKVDALEFDARERSQPFLPIWYRLLDAGLCLPLVGASAKDGNRVAMGSMRTYTLMEGEGRGLADWVEQTRKGRTFVTNGPILDFRVDGQPPGSRLVRTNGSEKRSIVATARSLAPFDRLEIVANGRVVAEAFPSGSPHEARIEAELSLPDGGWIAARCRGQAKPEIYPSMPVFAHSSPVDVRIEGKERRATAESLAWLRQLVEQTRDWIETTGQFAEEKSKVHLLGLCEAAMNEFDNAEPRTE